MGFNTRLRDAREAKGLTQLELANLLKIEPVVISRYERDKIKPHMDRLEGLADALGVTLDWLMLGRGDGPVVPANDSDLGAA